MPAETVEPSVAGETVDGFLARHLRDKLCINNDEIYDELRQALRVVQNSTDPEAPLFVGINNHGLSRAGDRITGMSILKILSKDDWKRELAVYAAAGLKVSGIDAFKGEFTQIMEKPDVSEVPLAVRYWGIEIDDEKALAGDGPLDPRAHLLPEALTGTAFAWPFVYVIAHIQTVAANSTTICAPPTLFEEDEPGLKRVAEQPSMHGLKDGFLLNGARLDYVDEYADTNLADKTAGRGKRMVFRFETHYKYPDGSIVTVPEGTYEENDWMERTIKEQEKLCAARDAAAAETTAELRRGLC